MIEICDRLRHNEPGGAASRGPGDQEESRARFELMRSEHRMARPREEIELELRLNKPEAARKYIANFDWGCPTPEYITWGLGHKIYFKNMTDQDAVFAAKLILRIEAKREFTTKEKLEGTSEVH